MKSQWKILRPWNEILFAPASSVTEKNKNWDQMSLEGGKWKIGQHQWKIFEAKRKFSVTFLDSGRQ